MGKVAGDIGAAARLGEYLAPEHTLCNKPVDQLQQSVEGEILGSKGNKGQNNAPP